ncbi:MAG: glutathione ABC transporter ATP-binding protein GsiA, partial [Rhodobacteraceae bacterium]|nr:glutathione ABC transporter ATP-binding protein GsiA [Paracoccaceae bacterium]
MYLGRIVEIGSRQSVFENPQHAYTKALMKAVPIADPTRRKSEHELNFKPIPSPIHDLDYQAEPSVYEKVGEDHFVLTTDSGY